MDLALRLAPPVRRNTKMELPISACGSQSFGDSMSIHIPMKSDSSSMFASNSSCQWPVAPQYDPPNCNYMQKSAQFVKSGITLPKMLIPKGPSFTISISSQTIVGGFVGSKTYAGRSMFGNSSLIWDALVCALMLKDKPPSEPKNKFPSMPPVDCVFGVDGKVSQVKTSNENICSPRSTMYSGSKVSVPRSFRFSNFAEMDRKVPGDSAQSECKAVVPESEELPVKSRTDILPCKGTYSSVVDGSYKSKIDRNGLCTMVKSSKKDQPPEDSRTCSQSTHLQSYADVAKIIPSKPVPQPSKSGCRVTQNLKNMWNSRIKRNKNTQNKTAMNCHGNKSNDIAVDYYISNGDTRWKGDWKIKRENFQRRCPASIPSNSSSSTDMSEESNPMENLTEDTESYPLNERKWTKDEKEPIRPGCLKEGLRGRHPSECSLDSEDSFVIFEDCPEKTWAASQCIANNVDSSEESDSEDDTCSSSGSSDYENDDDVDCGEQYVRFASCSSGLSWREKCNQFAKCSAQIVPEKSKGVKKKTVHFAEGSSLAVVRPMIAWGYAYRESRRGPWEVHARDRARFHCRVASLAPLLNKILDPQHRKVVASRLHNL